MTKNICCECQRQIIATAENPFFHTEEQKRICAKKIAERWVPKVSAVALITLFIFVGGAGVLADTDLHLFDPQSEIILTRENVQSITEPQGTTITGTCNCQVQSTLENFVQMPSRDGTTHFSGQVRDVQSTITFSDGTTILVEPATFPIPTWVLVAGGIGSACLIGAVVARRREQ